MLIMAVITIVLGVFTIVEKYVGSDYVLSQCYGSWVFFALWAAMGVSAAVHIARVKLWRRLPAFMLHLSLMVILIGAGMTFISAKRGEVSLIKGRGEKVFLTDGGERAVLPFTLTLSRYDIDYYPGSSFPRDYRAVVNAAGEEYHLSMNKSVSIQVYNFCLSKFESVNDCVTLNVSHDSGSTVAFIGFYLFFAAVVLMLWRGGEFNSIRKRLARMAMMALLAIAGTAGASAQMIDKSDAEALSTLLVENNGRIMPMESLSWSLMTKIHGSAEFEGMSPTQAVVDMYINSDNWGERKVIKIKSAKVRALLGISGSYASYNDFITDENVYKLNEAFEKANGESELSALQSCDERFQIMRSIIEGDIFKMFPAKTAGGVKWFSPVDRLPAEVEGDEYIFIRNAFNFLTEMIVSRRHSDFNEVVAKINKYQIKSGGSDVPSSGQRGSEHFLNQFRKVPLFVIALLCGIAGWIMSLVAIAKKRREKSVLHRAAAIIISAVSLLLLVEFCLKWYVGGHVPLGNGPETMAFTSMLIGVIYLLMGRRSGIHPSYALLMMGLTLLVSKIGNSDPQVTQLMPVLNSGLLSVHVALVMISYALFGLIFINSLTSLFISREERVVQERFTLTGRFLLYPAIALLGSGIFVGSLWASISWGRYWGWDPKETWALITMLIYAVPFHRGIFRSFTNPRVVNLYLTVAFLAVVVTYFGVNYFFGGMHSYS
jgi:ABC-type transport system involved in cytochrome c biogenesis permease subunit